MKASKTADKVLLVTGGSRGIGAATALLAARRGYRLVSANRFGFNLFYVREDLATPTMPSIRPDDVFRHARAKVRELPESALAGLPFVEP